MCLLWTSATAKQLVALGHDTAVRSELVPLGACSMLQLVPFHRSMSGKVASDWTRYVPTAVQALVAEQDTPVMEVVPAPMGTGSICAAHEVPFQAAACGCGPLVDGVAVPTATQLCIPAQETDVSALLLAPEGSGTTWVVHELPFHRSASGI